MARRLRNTQTAIAHWRQWRDGGLRKADSLALPGRLLKAALWHELHELLTGFAYPLFKIRAGRLPELILDYEAALDRWAGPEFPGAASKWRCLDALRDWRNFVVDYRLALTHAWIDPAVLAWNRADHGPVVEAARLNLEAQPSTLRLFLNHRPPLSIETPESIAVDFTWPFKIRRESDGIRLLVWSDACSIAWLDARTGALTYLSEKCGYVEADGDVSPDGSLYYGPGGRNTVDWAPRAWDLRTGRMVWESAECGDFHWPYSIHPSPDGASVLFTVSDYGPAGLIVKDGKPCGPETTRLFLLDATNGVTRHKATLAEGAIAEVLFHPDAQQIILRGGSGLFRIWNLSDGTIGPAFDTGAGEMKSMITSRGRELLVAHDSFAEWRALPGGKMLRSVRFPVRGSPVAISDDALRVAVSSPESITVMGLPDCNIIASLAVPEGKTWAAAFTSDGETLAAVFTDASTVRVWKLKRGSTALAAARWYRSVSRRRVTAGPPPLSALLEVPPCLPGMSRLTERFLLPSQKQAVWVFANGTIAICSSDGAKCLRSRHFPPTETEYSPEHIHWVAINKSGTRLALYSGFCSLWFVELETMTAISGNHSAAIDEQHHRSAEDALYTLDQGGSINRWDFMTGTNQPLLELDEKFTIPMFELSADHRCLIVFDCHGLMAVYDARTGAFLASAAEVRRIHRVWMKGNRLHSDAIGDTPYILTDDLPWLKQQHRPQNASPRSSLPG